MTDSMTTPSPVDVSSLIERLRRKLGKPNNLAVLCDEAADELERLAAHNTEADALREALAPSEETKAAYIGEFSFDVSDGYDKHGNERHREVDVPWTTIKEIMAAIRDRAALKQEPKT